MTNTPPNAGNTMPDAGEFTPGPWHIVRYGDGDSLVICLDEAGDRRVAFMATPGCRDRMERRKSWKQIKANARLIAAAPELLAELEYAVRLLASFGETAQVQRMRQVIAKAKGLSHD